MALDHRLIRLRALVDRIQRLPASERREWMVEEARSRVVDVETDVEPRPMRSLNEDPPPEPPRSRAPNGRAVKRPRPKPAPPAAPRRQAQPETPLVPAPAQPRIAGPVASAGAAGDDE